MAGYLRALTLENASARDVGSPKVASGAAAAAAAGSSAGSRGLGGSAGRQAVSFGAASSAASAAGGDDSDLEEFDRQTEGRGGSRDGTADTRDVPPCYKVCTAGVARALLLLLLRRVPLRFDGAAGVWCTAAVLLQTL